VATALRHLVRTCAVALVALIAFGCATTPVTPPAPREAVAELAPKGVLRAAINYGNPVLASKDPVTGEPRGVSVDLARELARRLGVPLAMVLYTAAGRVTGDARGDVWDVAFVAIDPDRAVDMDYTAAYVVIEGVYVVRIDSPIRTNAEIDRDGIRVVAAKGSAYDLFLQRELKRAKIVAAPTSAAVVDTMVAERVDVAAGVRQQMEADVKRVPGLRTLDTRFMVINQAMATPKGRPAGGRYLAAFVEEMKSSGFVAEGLRRSGVDGASVAPSAAR
jgi:polar amino acid transport system substrate-binding protein